MSEIFTFVDSTHIIKKNNLWEERDKAIAKNYEKINNDVLPKVAYAKEARILKVWLFSIRGRRYV